MGSGCNGTAGDGLSKHPVRGSVLVGGKPAKGLIVTFHNKNANAPGNAARPVGVVDESGRFELSTNADRDGAIVGEYQVTFFWPSDNTPNAFDRLGGQFTNVANSRFSAQVESRENELPAFQLPLEAKSGKATPKGARPPISDL